jgi:hypothetical protein
MELIYYVYVYYDGEIPIYVGKGKNNRYKDHLSRCFKQKRGSNLFYDKLRKILNSGGFPKIEIIKEGMTEEEALELERKKEQEFGTVLNKTGTLLNIAPCGNKNPVLIGDKNPMFGKNIFGEWEKKYDKEQLEKKIKEYSLNMSISLSGKIHTKETKEKQSRKRKEYFEKISEEEREKRSENISKSFTEERREDLRKKMIERNKKSSGKNSSRSRKCIVEGNIYDSIKEVQTKYEIKNHNTVRYRINSNKFKDWNWYE